MHNPELLRIATGIYDYLQQMVAEAVAADVVLKKRPQNLSIPNATAVDMAAIVAVCPPGI